jgi:cell division protein FtsI (penicillin-binding protein 3)
MKFFKVLLFFYLSTVALATDFDQSIESKIQLTLNKSYIELNPDAILLMILNNKTGKIELISSVGNIHKSNIQKYLFEPGSAIHPFVLAIALETNTIKPHSVIIDEKIDKTYNIKINNKITTKNIMTYNNTEAMKIIALKLSANELYSGLTTFGLNQKLRKKSLYDNKILRVSTAMGYGLHVSFEKLLQAYRIFTNNGKNLLNNKRVISSQNAQNIKNMLIDVVNNGSGKLAKRENLTIGGKNTTVHRIQNARYSDKMYNSSFFGFVEDKSNHSYSIGVIILNPKDTHSASKTAIPLWGNIVDVLVANKILSKK